MSGSFETLLTRALGLLVNASWSVTLLLGIVWTLVWIFRRASAAFRSLVWNFGVSAALILPFLLFFMPASWNLGWLSLHRPDDVNVSVASGSSAVPALETARALAPESPSMETNSPQAVGNREFYSLATRCAVGCWLAGALFMSGRFAFGYSILLVRARRINDVPEVEWRIAAQEAAHKLQISDEIKLLQSGENYAPAVWGFRVPLVLLPTLTGWSRERRLVILLHEFAHIKRKDSRTLLIQQIVAALYWFHPIVRLSLTAARRTCEQACDDLVLDAGVRPCDYADHLVEISQSLLPGKATQAVFCLMGTSSLEGRLIAILDPVASRRTPKAYVRTMVGLSLVPVLLLMTALRPLSFAEQILPDAMIVPDTLKTAKKEIREPRNENVVQLIPASIATRPSSENTQLAPETLGHKEEYDVANSHAIARSDVPLPAQAPVHDAVPMPSDVQQSDAIADVNESMSNRGDHSANGLAIPLHQEDEAIPARLSAPVDLPTIPATRSKPNTSGNLVLPAGTHLWLVFTKGMSSKTAARGDTVELALLNDIKVGDTVVAKAGSKAVGVVSDVKKARAPGKSGALNIQLKYIQADNVQIPIRRLPAEASGSDIQAYNPPFHLKWPLGLFRTGDDVEINQQTTFDAYVDANVLVPPV
jgi:beta-lactamase regulating signal transducer with metallopeptidase domain